MDDDQHMRRFVRAVGLAGRGSIRCLLHDPPRTRSV